MRAHARGIEYSFFGARTREMLGGVAALIARLGMRREVALYCELNTPMMSRRGSEIEGKPILLMI